jgi:hypothetical protein
MEVSGHLHLRPPYPQGKSPCYPLDRRLGWPQSRSGRGGEEKNFQPLPGLEPPITQPVVQRHTTVEMDLRQMGLEAMDLIHLVQDRYQ